MNLPEIIVNRHAIDRARERDGLTLALYTDGDLRELIREDVKTALREGRRSEIDPRSSWGTRSPGLTYAWTRTMSRVYTLREEDGRIFVTTTLSARRH